MKLLDLMEQRNIVDVEAELEMMGVTNYSINPDGTVDIDGNIEIPVNYASIPVQFNRVSGYFFCTHSKITSLVGAPSYVGKGLVCMGTKITSLVGAPSYIGGEVNCMDTPLLTAMLPIMKIKGIKNIIHEVGDIIMKHYKPDGTGDIIALQDDLIEAGWAHIARMK